jgi:excinuclease UvrABC ATPase subunit
MCSATSASGKRYNRETLEIRYKGKTIDEVLDLTVEDALGFFRRYQALNRKLQTLMDVGLELHAPRPERVTLSGGEAQRVKLIRELSKRDTGRTLYILDEPTTGLHFHDVKQLLGVLHRCATTATPSSSSSTTSTSSRPPTGSSTWGRRAATRAARSSPPARP